MIELLNTNELPSKFAYPHEFLRIVDLGLLDIEPWQILQGDLLRMRHIGIGERYPGRTLIPFAARQDNDDVACWEGDAWGVVIVHDFAEPGWEARESYKNFYDWLRRAVDDLIEFDD
ncbi:hypothetical protein [Nocardia sp. NPDC052566]|uniref:hypothetical protein n=1 Tax=Nocardia sp. NPDC052566 TaxID=3364330 RepID=UPI0037C6DDD2